MKPEIKEYYDLYDVGQKVLVHFNTRYHKGWERAIVQAKEIGRNTASIQTKEEGTGELYWTMFRLRNEIKHACMEEGCWNEAIACRLVDYFASEPKETTEWFCVDHCHQNGYCYMCGEFWGGVEYFEFSKTGLCENCQSELEAELNNPDDLEDFAD